MSIHIRFFSDIKLVRLGISQYFTLSALFSLLHINDLKDVFKHCMVHHFVDNTSVSYVNKYIKNINEEPKELINWSRATKLSLNKSKTPKIKRFLFHTEILIYQ